MKTELNRMGRIRLFPLLFQNGCSQSSRFLPQARRIVGYGDENDAVSVWKRCCTLSAHGQMNSTHAHFNISAREIGAKLKLHGSACPPFWILTVDWFWWRHRFQMASFSPSTLDSSVFKKHRFQIAPLWRAFSIGSVFGDRFRRCSVDDSRIRSKTAPFSFENGLVWSGLEWKLSSLLVERLFVYGPMDIGTTLVITYKKIIGEYIGLTSANIKLMIWWTFWNRAQYTGWTFHYVKKIH